MKISLLAGHIKSVRVDKKPDEKKTFIIIVTLDEGDPESNEWEGTVNMLRSTIQRTENKILREVKQKNDQIIELVTTTNANNKKSSSSVNKRLDEKMGSMDEKMEDIED